MNAREISIAEAAVRVYSRQGVRQTTMNDIAIEAGVTRQTVYNAFPNTDEVLRAAIRFYVALQWDKIQTGWDATDQLGERLDILFQHFVIEIWEYTSNSPAAAELEAGHNAAGRAEMERAAEVNRGNIATLFEGHRARLVAKGTTPEALSDLLTASFKGIKTSSKSRAAIDGALGALKATILALLGEAA